MATSALAWSTSIKTCLNQAIHAWGGYYHFDYTSNRIILDRSSYDFGNPKWHLLEILKVPSVNRGLRLVYIYDDDRKFDVSEELNIEYYD